MQLLFVEMVWRITHVRLQRGEPGVEFGDAVAEAVAFRDREESGAVVLLSALVEAGGGVNLGDTRYGLNMVVVDILNGLGVSVDPLYKNTVNLKATLLVSR